MKISINYIKNKKGKKYGVAVAILLPEQELPNVGLARCNMKVDNFSKKRAVELATDRALKWGIMSIASHPASYPDWNNHHIEDYLQEFISTKEEFKFMQAIDFVIREVTSKEKHAPT